MKRSYSVCKSVAGDGYEVAFYQGGVSPTILSNADPEYEILIELHTVAKVSGQTQHTFEWANINLTEDFEFLEFTK